MYDEKIPSLMRNFQHVSLYEKLSGSVSVSESSKDLLWSWMTGIPFSEMPGLKEPSSFKRSSVSSWGWLPGGFGCPFSTSNAAFSWGGGGVYLLSQNAHGSNWIRMADVLKNDSGWKSLNEK